MKYYNVTIQVEFDTPRQMSPLTPSGNPWHAVGYFQTFFCTEHSKEKSKKLVYGYFLQNEDDSTSCKFRFERVAWMRWVTKREQIGLGFTSDLTDEMFSKRDQVGIWYCGKKDHYVSEQDGAAAMLEECHQKNEAEDS